MKTCSVLLALYNGSAYIEEQLDSIVSGTRMPDEILIGDDGSTDDSVQIVRRYCQMHPNAPVRLIQNPANLGYIGNFASLMKESRGDLVFLCDQDDRWHPKKLETMANLLETLPQAVLLASSFQFMDASGQGYSVPAKKGWSNNNLLPKALKLDQICTIPAEEMVYHNYFQGCSMVLRRSLVQAYLDRFDSSLPHDWYLALLAAAQEGLYFVNTPLFDYRIHQANTTGLPQSSRHPVWDKLKAVNSEYNRTIVFRQSVQVLNTIEKHIPEIWNDRYRDKREFALLHLEALQERSLKKLWRHASHPEASRYLSKAGRFMDFVFVLSHRKG